MTAVSTPQRTLPAMQAEDIDKVRRLEAVALRMPQLEAETTHALHVGMYARTVRIPAGALLTGALIKIPTLLIVVGDATVFIGGEAVQLRGHNVIPADAGRKQAFIALTDTFITMLFATSATTVEEAENEFTDEAHLLLSRRQGD